MQYDREYCVKWIRFKCWFSRVLHSVYGRIRQIDLRREIEEIEARYVIRFGLDEKKGNWYREIESAWISRVCYTNSLCLPIWFRLSSVLLNFICFSLFRFLFFISYFVSVIIIVIIWKCIANAHVYSVEMTNYYVKNHREGKKKPNAGERESEREWERMKESEWKRCAKDRDRMKCEKPARTSIHFTRILHPHLRLHGFFSMSHGNSISIHIFVLCIGKVGSVFVVAHVNCFFLSIFLVNRFESFLFFFNCFCSFSNSENTNWSFIKWTFNNRCKKGSVHFEFQIKKV